MAFAPDGRLFVAEQGGRLRVIKNGALLAAPFVTVDRQLVRRARAARRRLRPELREQPVRLRLLHDRERADPQPRQPLHRERRRRRAGQRGRDPRAREPVERDEPQRRRAALRRPTASSTSPSATTRTARTRRRSATASARCCASTPDGTIPSRTRSTARRPAPTARSGRWGCATRSRSRSSRAPAAMFINDVGQNTWEEINDGIAGANYGWPATEGPTTDPRFRVADLRLRARDQRDDRLRDHRRRVLQPADRAVPGEYVGDYFFADYCSGWIRKLDPGERATRSRTSPPASPAPSTSRSRATAASTTSPAARAASVFRVAYTASQAPTHHDAPGDRPCRSAAGDVHRRGQRDAAAGLPVAAQRRRHPRRDVGELHASPPGRPPTTAPASASGHEQRRQRPSNAATLTVTSNQAPTATITPPAGRRALQRRADRSPTPARAPTRRTARCPASAFTWQVDFHHDDALAPVRRADERRDERLVRRPDPGETESERLVPHPPDGPRLGGPDALTVFRDVLPRTVQLTLATSPAGLSLPLDGQPRRRRCTVTGVVGDPAHARGAGAADGRRQDLRVRRLVRRRRASTHRHARRRTRPTPRSIRAVTTNRRADRDLLRQRRLHRRRRCRASTGP